MLPALDQLPPQSSEAERSVLGCLLRENRLFEEIGQTLIAEDFYFDANRKVYTLIADEFRKGRPVDLVRLFELTKSAGWEKDIGGGAYIAELWEAAPTGANAHWHAKLVKEKASARRLIQLCSAVTRDAYTASGESVAELVARFESQVFKVSEGSADYEPIRLDAAMQKVIGNIDDRLQGKSKGFIPTGLTELDQLIGGLRGGRLYVLAARPGGGKSAMGLKYAIHSAAVNGVGSFVFSMEMTAEEWAERVFAGDCEIPLNRITGGTDLGQGEVRKLVDCADRFGGVKCFIDERGAHTIDTIAATARRAVRKHKVGLIIVDYLQLIKHAGRNESMSDKIGYTTRDLKELAKSLDVPVVLLSQLNRESENRPDKMPTMADLRSSGNIEQDADCVLLLWPQVPQGGGGVLPAVQEIRVIVAKQRSGPTGEAHVEYVRAFTRFQSTLPRM